MDNRSLSHIRWKCQYHIVFIPKYRKKILYGKILYDVREILETLCEYKQVDIIAGAICIDHVYLSVAIPQKSSEFVERNAENQAFLTCKFHICLLY